LERVQRQDLVVQKHQNNSSNIQERNTSSKLPNS
jgi:hypothetical protein